jgi:hypothetical protein
MAQQTLRTMQESLHLMAIDSEEFEAIQALVFSLPEWSSEKYQIFLHSPPNPPILGDF